MVKSLIRTLMGEAALKKLIKKLLFLEEDPSNLKSF